jgi:hypothetical protein
VSTYYVKNGGNDGADGLNDTNAWATFNNINKTKIVAGDTVRLKRGSIWRDFFEAGTDFNGTSSDPIIVEPYGDTGYPIISGASLITGWTLYSGNVWQAALSTHQSYDHKIFIDGTVGDYKATIGELVNEGDWTWASDVLYLYAPSDPDTAYTNPGVEARTRQHVVLFHGSYWIYDGLWIEKPWQDNFRSYAACGHVIIRNNTSRWGGRNGIGITGGNAHSYSEFYGNECSYNEETGISANQLVDHLKVYRNEVHHNGGTVGGGDEYRSSVKFWGDGLDYIEVYENYIHDDDNAGVWFDGATCANHSTIHHNRIEKIFGDGIFIEISKNIRIWNNLIVDCHTDEYGENGGWNNAGIAISGRENFNTDNNLVYNNTVYGCNIGISVWQDLYDFTTATMQNNIIKNNICLGNVTRPLSCGNGGDNNGTYNGSGNVYEYNCFGVESANFIRWAVSGDKSTYDAWETAYGGSTHSIEADPLFTNAAGGVFTLQAGSPCINAGANLGDTYKYGLMHDSAWPAAVVLGDQDDYGAGWEVGAYIYESGGGAWIVGALAVGGS